MAKNMKKTKEEICPIVIEITFDSAVMLPVPRKWF